MKNWLKRWVGVKEEVRSIENPNTPLDDANVVACLGDSLPSTAGTPVSAQSAMTLSSVYAAVRILAETVGSLPLQVYKRAESGKENASNHRLYPILHDTPNRLMTSMVFREVGMAHLALWGNFYAELERDKAGRVIGLWPIHPSRVRVFLSDSGDKRYVISGVKGGQVTLLDDDVLHIPALGFDGLVGLSPLRLMRNAIGLGLGAEQYGAQLFANGGRPSGVLSTEGKLTDLQVEQSRARWKKVYGGASDGNQVAVLEGGLKYQAISMPPEEAQFLQTRKFQISEIARMFRVPPHMLADLERSTFSNIEHQGIEFTTHSIRPWLVRWEQELNRKLFAGTDYFCEFSLDALLRGDAKSQMEGFAIALRNGIYCVNDVLDKLNMPRVEGGDKRMVQAQMIPLDKIGELNDNSSGSDGKTGSGDGQA
ncbi:MAG: phage portal protein [Proteobacteria bacterium]|nr:phage portal protein [Pseudomonadota bacterium]